MQVLRGLDVAAALSGNDRWFSDVQAIHDEAIRRQIARETALDDRDHDCGAVQPGLFDRRALAAAERIETSGAIRTEDRRRHIEALERSRLLRLTSAPSAVLIVWR